MPTFRGTDFTIELPTEVRDESTYAFALPARSSFRPSIVVKTERLAAPTELPDYVDKQLANIRSVLPRVTVVSSAALARGAFPAHAAVYDFGDDQRRVRQKQRYILLGDPLRVVTLTATSLRDTFAEAEPLFEAIFNSFAPVVQPTVSGS